MQIGMFNKDKGRFRAKTMIGRSLEQNLLKNTTDVTLNTLKLQKEYLESKDGIGERIWDTVNDFTEIGINKKRARKVLQKYEQGKISKEATEAYLKQYEYNKKDAVETGIDVATSLAALATFTWVQGFIKNTAQTVLPEVCKSSIKSLGGMKVSTAITTAGVLLAGLTGMIVKPVLKAINKIPADKKSKKKNKSSFKDAATGFANGAMAPVAGTFKLLGLIPFAVANTSLRYLTLSKDNKSFDDFMNQQTQNIDTKILAVAAMGTGAYVSNKNIEHWKETSEKAIHNCKKMKLDYTSLANGKDNAFESIADSTKIFENDKIINNIINNNSLTTDEKIKKLEEYNIFLGKYFQTFNPSPDFEELKQKFGTVNPTESQKQARLSTPYQYNNFKRDLAINDLASKIKADCPPSRTVGQAQEIISKTFGSQYEVIKSAGVGTIGETYLAKDKTTGQEVIIKMVKEGIDTKKISEDKQFMLDLVRNNKKIKKDTKQLKKIEGQIEDLFTNWIDETDFNKERENALLLAKNNTTFKVPKPIVLKDDIYVMEKAEGIQLNQLPEYLRKNNKKLSRKEYKWINEQYKKIIEEQMNTTPKEGNRIIHADPHSGNIFVDLDKKQFTLIDTGNVAQKDIQTMTNEEFFKIDSILGDSSKIVDKILKDSILPPGMSIEQAKALVLKDVNKELYNYKTFSFDVTSNIKTILNKYKITTKDTGANLIKANGAHWQNTKLISALPQVKPIKEELKQMEEEAKKAMDKAKSEGISTFIKALKDNIIKISGNNPKYFTEQLKLRFNRPKEEHEKMLTYLSYPFTFSPNKNYPSVDKSIANQLK